jgi:hypothetical protein
VLTVVVIVCTGVAALLLVRSWTAPPNESAATAPAGTSVATSVGGADPSAPGVPVTGLPAAEALLVLDTLTVLPERPDVSGYQRGCGAGQRCSFGSAWTDDSSAPDGHNGCGTRNDVLREQLTDVSFAPGSTCVVVAGTLLDPYTGAAVAFRKAEANDVQIDHVYPLARAFDMGAAGWTQERRTAFANDTELELLAVTGAVNQAKGDAGPAEWMPPDPAAACGYVQRYIAVARAYALAVTAAEQDSMRTTLGRCG